MIKYNSQINKSVGHFCNWFLLEKLFSDLDIEGTRSPAPLATPMFPPNNIWNKNIILSETTNYHT